jgi:hypothetical protein
MDLVVAGFIAGVLGTLAMDLLNDLVARTGVILKIDVAMIGRMAASWTRGRFRHRHPEQIHQAPNEMVYGYVAHYATGVGLAITFILGWDFWVGGLPSTAWTIVYAVVTTVASFLFVYPSMGLGVFGRRSPVRIKAFITPLANHLFYGWGLAVGIALA